MSILAGFGTVFAAVAGRVFGCFGSIFLLGLIVSAFEDDK